MDDEERMEKVIERRNARRDDNEEDLKLDREVTERDTDSSKSRFEQLIEEMSPEEAADIMDELDV